DAAQTVLDFHHRDVDIGPRLKGHRDRRGSVRTARRRHIAKALDAVDLLFEALRAVFGDDLRVGTRVNGADGQRRRGDGRVLLDREQPQRNDAAQENRKRDDPRKNGSIDEKLRTQGATLTGAPGPTFWRPSTMTRSPTLRPSRIAHCPPSSDPTVTGRISTVSFSPTT